MRGDKEIHIHELYEEARVQVQRDAFSGVRLSRKGLGIAKEQGNILFEYRFSLLLARAYQNSGELSSALETILFNQKVAEKYFSSDNIKMSDTYISVGLVYYYLDYKDFFLEYNLKALKYSVEEHEISILNNIIGVYLDAEEYEKALSYTGKALGNFDKYDDFTKISLVSNLCVSLIALDRLSEAKSQLKRIEKIATNPQMKPARFYTLLNWADIYTKERRYDEAMKFIDEALALIQELEYWVMLCLTLQSKCSIYLKMGNEESAEQYASLAVDAAAEHEVPQDQVAVFEIMKNYYKEKRRWREALSWSERKSKFHENEIRSYKRRNVQTLLKKNKLS